MIVVLPWVMAAVVQGHLPLYCWKDDGGNPSSVTVAARSPAPRLDPGEANLWASATTIVPTPDLAFKVYTYVTILIILISLYSVRVWSPAE